MELKEARKAANMSQAVLAEKIGVNRATLSKYETGQIKPSISQLEKIADVLGISLLELLPVKTLYVNSDNLEEYAARSEQTSKEIAEAFSKYNELKVHEEYKPNIQLVMDSRFLYQPETVALLYSFNCLNNAGKQKVVDYADDLSLNSKYQRTEEPNTPSDGDNES